MSDRATRRPLSRPAAGAIMPPSDGDPAVDGEEATMRAITMPVYGGPDVLKLEDLPRPVPGPGDLLVRVRAAGVNRADCLQRAGNYPMPRGISSLVPGLELAGEVERVGESVAGYRAGDRVFGLVAEGAYAEYARLDQGLAIRIPEAWDFVTAAAVTEVFCTANETVFEVGGLKAGESILIHAGASGVGTAAVQMAKQAGATVYFTAGSRTKIDRVEALGGDFGVLYKSYDFVEEIFRASAGEGVDQIEDFIGAAYLMRNLSLLKERGRLVLVGLMGGDAVDLRMGVLLRKRLQILGFTLRAQSLPNKRAIVGRVRERWLPRLVDGTIRPIIHATFPLEQAAAAHAMMERDENFGKIVLTLD
jgi:NADPH2:quinone reductase